MTTPPPAIVDFHDIIAAINSRGATSPNISWFKEVEWLAILQAISQNGQYPATNPTLLQLVIDIPGLKDDPVFWTSLLLAVDADTKTVLKNWYLNPNDRSPLRDSLELLNTKHGSELWQLLEPYYQQLYALAAPLCYFENTGAQLTRISGDLFNFSVNIYPSLFIPPPQKGRYGWLLKEKAGAALVFGFPLEVSPEVYGINTDWLSSGAFHFAARQYLGTVMPDFLHCLQDNDEFLGHLKLIMEKAGKTLESGLGDHLLFTLSALRGIEAGVPYKAFSLIASARNLRLFKFFFKWFKSIRQLKIPLSKSMIDFVNSAQKDLLYLHAMAETVPPVAPVINLLLMQKNTFPIRLNFSAAFDQSSRQHILNRWTILNATVLLPEDNLKSAANILVSFKTKDDGVVNDGYEELNENDISISLFDMTVSCWEIVIIGKDVKQLTALPVEVLLKTSYSKVLIKDNQIIKGWNHALDKEKI